MVFCARRVARLRPGRFLRCAPRVFSAPRGAQVAANQRVAECFPLRPAQITFHNRLIISQLCASPLPLHFAEILYLCIPNPSRLGGGMVDTRDLRLFLSALSEKRDVECRKFKETLTDKAEGNLEPSL